VSGKGVVAGKAAGQIVACGASAVRCFGTFEPGTQVSLRADPAKGFEFSGWSGSCKGSDASCLIRITKAAAVSARFAATGDAAVVPLDIADAAFAVSWTQGVGSGRLTVEGKIGKASDLAVQLRQANGKPFATGQFSVPAGAFDVALKLEPGLVAGELLPGGYVVSVAGSSGDLTIPPEVKAVTLPAPADGVVQRAFASASANGSPKASLHGSQAFAHFVFAAAPTSKRSLSIAWYEPNGKLLGVAKKAAGLTITSSISSESNLPPGTWRADLRLGNKVVETLLVPVR
jgi:hypothetical protein